MHSKPNRTPIQPRNAPMRPGLSVSPGTRHMQDDTKYAITMDNVNKWFGHLHVLKDIDIRIKDKEKVVICGPSGSGKSRSEEHTSELQSLMRLSYAVFCLKKKKNEQRKSRQ